MRFISLIVMGGFLVTLAGCASTQQVQDLRTQVSSLEDQIKAKQDTEESLRDNQKQLEMALKKQLEANLELRQKLEGLQKTAQKEEEPKAKIQMPSGKDIQTALRNAGFYKGVVDGVIGSETKDAIKKFQEASNLTPDGVVGSRTWELLSKHLEGNGENLK